VGSLFRSSLVYCHLHGCGDPTDLPILNSNLYAREGESENYMPQSRSDIPEQLTNRNSVDDFMNAMANVNTHGPDVEQEVHARDESDNLIGAVERNVPRDVTSEPVAQPVSTDDLLAAMLSDRDLNTGQEIQTRDLLSYLFKALQGGFLRRNVNHDQLLAARDGAEDLINSIMARNPEQQMRARGGFAQALNALASSRRDDAPEGLAARGDWEDLVKILNNRELGSKRDMRPRGLLTSLLAWGLRAFMSLPIRIRGLTPDELVGRDAVDDILDVYMPNMNHATREPLPQQETQARGIPDGPKTVARDGSAANDFINALLHSRDSSGELTPDHVLSLASLASRALDELD
jgi:hypothetical protein